MAVDGQSPERGAAATPTDDGGASSPRDRLRPVTLLVPDVTRPGVTIGFASEIRRQIRSLNQRDEEDALRFIEAAMADDVDEAG